MRRLCLLGVLLTSCVWLSAQQPAQPAQQSAPVFRTSADLATIDAVVTDSDGQPVTDLTPDDFEVIVSGKRQPLDQAVYIRTQDQPKVLAAARAAANQNGAAPADTPAKSMVSRALQSSSTTPDQVARTIAIVVDDLGLSFRGMFDTRNAIHRYIDTQIEPGDLVAIIRTAGGIGALQQFTTDKRLLHLAADRLVWDFRSRQGLGVFGPGEATGGEGALNSADWLQNALVSVGSLAALEFIAQGAAELPGRKCIVFFSEGFNQIFNDRKEGSQRIWDAMARMLARANAAGVVINTVDARGLVALGVSGPVFANSDVRTRDGFRDPTIQRIEGTSDAGSGNGYLDAPGHRMGAADTTNGRPFVGSRALLESQESLRFIANQTGGLAVDNTNDLNRGVTRILDDQQGYYLLGYTAAAGAARDGWDQNRVKVKVRRKGLQVRARQGFFGPVDTRAPNTAPMDPLVKSALSPFESDHLTVRLTSLFGYDAAGAAPFVRSLLFIDPSDVHFETDDAGRHAAHLQILLMAIGDNGQVVDSSKREVPLALTDQAFRRVSEHGLVVTIRSTIKQPGPYQMRAAVHDIKSNTVGSASQFLKVPEVGRGQLALSGLILKGTAEGAKDPAGAPTRAAPDGLGDSVLSEPEVRVFSPGNTVLYTYEIYDGLSADNAELQIATSVIRSGKVVYRSEFTPVTTSVKSDGTIRTIPIVGTLAIAADMPVGSYTLEVIVQRREKKKIDERTQWIDFEIRR